VRHRLAALEARVAQLESGRAGPGDGRAAAPERPARTRRCPGCGLTLRSKGGRCAACGRPVDRARGAPAKPRRPR